MTETKFVIGVAQRAFERAFHRRLLDELAYAKRRNLEVDEVVDIQARTPIRALPSVRDRSRPEIFRTQGYNRMVKIAQIAKTCLFPSQVEALGSLGPKLATVAFWHPTFPYKSSLTGLTATRSRQALRACSGFPCVSLLTVAAAPSGSSYRASVPRRRARSKPVSCFACAFAQLRRVHTAQKRKSGTNSSTSPRLEKPASSAM